MGSLCLVRSHFTTWSIPSVPLAVSKHIEKQMFFQASPNTCVENCNWKGATSLKVQAKCSPIKTLVWLCLVNLLVSFQASFKNNYTLADDLRI